MTLIFDTTSTRSLAANPATASWGKEIEAPISELIGRGHHAVCEHLEHEGPWLFFVWFNLIFVKTHLMDRTLRLHQDRRKPDDRISDHYTWEQLHHIHCVARSF